MHISYQPRGLISLKLILAIINKEYGWDTVLFAPKFNCMETFSQSVSNFKGDIIFYCCPSQLKSLLGKGDKKTKIILAIDYFGITDLTIFFEIKKSSPNCILILDLCHSYFSWSNVDFQLTVFDYIFTSLRKMLPVPDGSVVFTKSSKTPGSCKLFSEPSFYWQLLTIIDRSSYSQRLFQKARPYLFNKHEKTLTKMALSKISSELFNTTDHEIMRSQRSKNFKLYTEKLGLPSEVKIFDIRSDNLTPLYFPFFTVNPEELVNRLSIRKLFCPIFWPGLDSRIIGLPLDERYDRSDINYICDTVIEVLGF